MALTVTGGRRRRVGKNILMNLHVVFDSSYVATTGEPMPTADVLDGVNVLKVAIRNVSGEADGDVTYDNTNDSMMCYVPSTGAAKIATDDLSALICDADVTLRI